MLASQLDPTYFMNNTKTNTENAIASENCDEKAIALAAHLGISPDEVTQERYENYGLTVYSADSGEYAVGTDDEAEDAAREYIADSAWAFNSSFLSDFTGLPEEMFAAVQEKCEAANDAVVECIKRADGGMWRFASFAISADGRGHFLASYDGDEIELGGGFYAFRIN